MNTPTLKPPVYWNPYNQVVQDHRDGTIDHEATNTERAKRGLPVPWDPSMAPGAPKPTLEDHIRSALNTFSSENGSDTPDFILAQYLMGCLDVWNMTVRNREAWYGRIPKQSEVSLPPSHDAKPS